MLRRTLFLGFGTLLLSGMIGCDVNSSKPADQTPATLHGANAPLMDSSDFTTDIPGSVTPGYSTWYRLAVVKDSVYCFSVVGEKATDTRLDVLSGTAETVLASNDDALGLDPMVTYKATATGEVRIRVEGASETERGDYYLHIDPSDRYESDDSVRTASLITADGTVTRRILVGDVLDTDWMKVRTQRGVEYRLNCDVGVPNFSFYMADPRYKYQLSSEKSSIGGESSYAFLAEDSFTYIQATKASTSMTSTVYRVWVSKNTGDSYEPDNFFSVASAISLDSTVQSHTISSINDDMVKIPVVKGRFYKLTLNSTTDLYATFYSNDTIDVDHVWAIKAGVNTKLIETGAQRFIYMNIGSDGDGSGSYQLAVVEFSAATEPDNNMTTAIPLAVGVPTNTHYLVKDHVQWHKFSADSGKTYTLTHPVKDIWFPKTHFWNSDSTLVSEHQTHIYGGNYDDHFYCIKSGTYYYSAASEGVGMFNTRLDVSSTVPSWYVAPDAFEPDNQLATATTLKPDSTEVTHTLLDGDEDWTKIPLDSGRTYSFNIQNLRSSSLTYSLFSSDSTELQAGKNLTYSVAARYTYTARRKTNVYQRVAAEGTTEYTLRVWSDPIR